MLRAMKFSESGLECWPCQCVLVISWTYSSRGNYLWKVSYPGNVTKSRGGEGGGGAWGGRVTLIGNTPEGISRQRNRNKLRRQCETISQAHFTLCLDNSKKTRCWLQWSHFRRCICQFWSLVAYWFSLERVGNGGYGAWGQHFILQEEHKQVPWVAGFHYPDSFFVYLCAREKKSVNQ